MCTFTWDVKSWLLWDTRQRSVVVRSSNLQRLTLENDSIEGHGLRRLVYGPKLNKEKKTTHTHTIAVTWSYSKSYCVLLVGLCVQTDMWVMLFFLLLFLICSFDKRNTDKLYCWGNANNQVLFCRVMTGFLSLFEWCEMNCNLGTNTKMWQSVLACSYFNLNFIELFALLIKVSWRKGRLNKIIFLSLPSRSRFEILLCSVWLAWSTN